jgi:Spy/CpxP family protein refolding chaperone
LNYGIALKNEAIRNDATLTQEQKKERIKMNNDQRKIQLQNMLTAEQNAKMEALEKERMERRQEKGKKPMKGAPSQEAEELEGL